MSSTNNPFATHPSPGAPNVPSTTTSRPKPSGLQAPHIDLRSSARTHESVRGPHLNVPDSSPPARGNLSSSAPAKLLGSWQLNRLVGHGAFSTVYEARPLGCPPDRPADYVVKVLKATYTDDPTARRSMEREAEVGRDCSHEHLVPIFESRLNESPAYLVMPRIDGVCLQTVIQRVGSVAISQSLWITRQIAEALHHLHQKGWVHGDVKPGNMMVSRHGHATLIDLAFAMKPGDSLFDQDRPLQATLGYVAPEMITSANATHPAADIYSLGVSLYEMLAGQLPFPEVNAEAMVEAHLRKPVPDFASHRHVPEPIKRLVRRMMAKSPVRRPQSAAELIDDLMNIEIETLETRFP